MTPRLQRESASTSPAAAPKRLPTEALAHLTQDGRGHGLRDHLRSVGRLARHFAAAFDSADWGFLAGLWHDLGKYAADFQAYVRQANGFEAHLESESIPGRVDHSSAGAVLAAERFKDTGRALSLAIAGHHAGLADFDGELRPRLEARAQRLRDALSAGVPHDLLDQRLPSPPPVLRGPFKRGSDAGAAKRRYEMWVRFIFSALVDADFLDTEAFYDATRAAQRGGGLPIGELRDKLDQHLGGLAALAADTEVNRARAAVLQACRSAAAHPPGLFSLTVPTGGGKTLSAMAFALAHATHHDLQRVIAVIPYTSIIEQNADVYRKALGDGAVVEHHSGLEPETETPRNRIACENWDAPIVVTTSVQFFESLFSNRSSACRKLHNLARSVIILDEVQTLPPGLLAPILDALRDLPEVYGASVVLSTATQPALKKREALPLGLEGVREIAVDLADCFSALRRTRVNWPSDLARVEDWPSLAERMAAQPRVLAIVHKRADARRLVTALDHELGDTGTYHLSALMCPAHRLEVLQRIKAALRRDGPVRVVSTQLVEAGVDLDFPAVFRALGGIDSITQAAGRCNREGQLRDANGQPALGVVDIFVAESQPPVGVPRTALEVTRTMLSARHEVDLFVPETHEAFFRQLYFARDLDAKRLQALRQEFQFRTVAGTFRMIEDAWQQPVVVRYGDAGTLLERLRYQGVTRGSLRALQRFTVSIPRRALADLEKQGAAQLVEGNVWAIGPGHEHLYDQRVGLLLDSVIAADPETLIG